MASLFITGIAGFIGSHFAEAALKLGHRVVGIDSFDPYYSRALKDINANVVRNAGGEIIEGDLVLADLIPLIKEAEFIYHCAAQPGISAVTSFDQYLRNNIVATHRLVETCLKNANNLKCFVNVATSSVYGKNATDSEDTPAKPTSHYGVTKLAAEQLVLAAYREQGLPACSLRLFSVYGPRERPDKLYPRLIAATLDKAPFPLYKGSENHSRSFTYIDDIISGFLRVLAVPEAWKGEIFNIGSDLEITTSEGIRLVSELCGQDVLIEYRPPRNGDQLRTLASINKAKLMLNYSPTITTREGLKRQIEWMKNERQNFADN